MYNVTLDKLFKRWSTDSYIIGIALMTRFSGKFTIGIMSRIERCPLGGIIDIERTCTVGDSIAT